MSYQNTAYLAGAYQIEAAKNPNTEQVRAVEPLETILKYQASAIAAEGEKRWSINLDLFAKSLWIAFASTPSGNITLYLEDAQNNAYLTLVIPVASKGEILGNTWCYRFGYLPIKRGDRVRIKPSVEINSAFLFGEPCLISDPIQAG